MKTKENKLSPDWSKLTLQQKICAIFQRTIHAILHIFSKLCVSLKKDNSTTEKDLFEKEKCGKFEKNKKGMIETIHEFIMTYEVMVKIILTIMAGLTAALTFWFAMHNYTDRITNKYSINESETKITLKPLILGNGDKCFTGAEMEFVLINKTDTLTIIKEAPKIYVRIYYNYTEFFKRKDFEVTKYVDLKTIKTYPLRIEKRLNREYFTYKLRNEFFNWVKKDIERDKVVKICVYLTFSNDVTKKTMQTKPNSINKEIYDSKVQWNLNVDKGVDILKKLGDIK